MRKITLTALALLALATPGWSKNPIPTDRNVITDTLPNGLRYYIRNNKSPHGQADFFIAQRVGSLNEEENQRGLAHFLEHMCFNGTRHFSGKNLINYLERNGVRFGANLNAYTSTDETVYNISNVPVNRGTLVDSCLLILKDWSCGLELAPAEIDAERGVIANEWRQRMGTPSSRLMEKSMGEVFGATRYGHRMPIGRLEVIQNFSHQALRDFYDKWYRPQNQAVIVVGDINPQEVEGKIRRMFADVPRGAESCKTPVYPSNLGDGIKVSVNTDREQTVPMLQIYFRHRGLDEAGKRTIDALRESYMTSVIAGMLAERFDEIENTPGAPFRNLGVGDVQMLMSKDRAFALRAFPRSGRTADCAQLLMEEMKRAATHGFLPSELERARVDYASGLESRFAKRDRLDNTELAKRYASHFTKGGSLPSEEAYYKMMQGVMQSVKLEDINARMRAIMDSYPAATAVIAYLPESDASESGDVIAARMEQGVQTDVAPYTDRFESRPLLAETPRRGRIVSERDLGKFGAREWTLSNGVKVVLRHNSAHPDQIRIKGEGPGGVSALYDLRDAHHYRMLNDVIPLLGYGGETAASLRKQLVGKKSSVKVSINNMDEAIEGATTPQDLETAFQLIYLKATAPSADSVAFAAWRDERLMQQSARAVSATAEMGDSIHSNVYGRHPLGLKLSAEDLRTADLARILDIYRQRFADMSDFTFYISGNYDEEQLRGLVETYLASLPGGGRKEKAQDVGYRYAGNMRKVFERKMETPSAIVYSLYTGPCEYNLANYIRGDALGQILKSRMRDEIREKRGLTYGVKAHIGINAGMNGQDPSQFIMPVYIKATPGHEDEVSQVVDSIVKGATRKGSITAEEVERVKSYLLKDVKERDEDNGYWVSVMRGYGRYGVDMHSGYQREVEALSPESLRKFGARLFNKANRVELIMKPE